MSPTVRRLPRFLVLALLSAPALHAQEASDPGTPDLDRLRSEQQALRPQIESAQGPYADLSRRQRKALLDRQAELLALIEGRQSLAELTPAQRTEALNALQALAAAGQDAGGEERQVCKREKSIGSHRTTTVCRSPAQSESQATEARRQIEAGRMQREL